MNILVTGGAGFIGSALVRRLIAAGHSVRTLDKLTYAGSELNLREVATNPAHRLDTIDITDAAAVRASFESSRPQAVIHLAAETHVDKSINDPEQFVKTNVVGTQVMLQEAQRFWEAHPDSDFRFLHVSTDEVYGDLSPTSEPVQEGVAYRPSSPYAASKAAADHLVAAWRRTYGLPTLVTNCSNNYGPYQYPEKLIPYMIMCALNDEPLPLYGDGLQVRDWLHVDDHTAGLVAVLREGHPGETYHIGARCERTNLDVVKLVCKFVADATNRSETSFSKLINFVADRPGHDLRYALSTEKIKSELGWTPSVEFEAGLKATVDWYLTNKEWVESTPDGQYRAWTDQHYSGREHYRA